MPLVVTLALAGCGGDDDGDDVADGEPTTTTTTTVSTTSTSTDPPATTTAEPAAQTPEEGIEETGSDPSLDRLAEQCYEGDLDACDQLFFDAGPNTGYRDYGDSCAGRQDVGTGNLCTEVFG